MQTHKSPGRIQFSSKTLHKSILYRDGAQLEEIVEFLPDGDNALPLVNHQPYAAGLKDLPNSWWTEEIVMREAFHDHVLSLIMAVNV